MQERLRLSKALTRRVLKLEQITGSNAEDKTVLMRLNGKDYTLTNLTEGIQKLIEFSRATP